MQIHNWYSDLVLSIRSLFDNVIFPAKYIKSYSFNIANASFELSKKDYRTQFEYPAAIIALLDDIYTFGEKTTSIQHAGPYNSNMITVLVNPTDDASLFVQEEHVSVSISVKINCESQLQAKEIEFRIKDYLPLNKFISTYDFTSFLEIPTNLLQTLNFDYHNDEIPNLFMRLNRNLGIVEYCFSMSYKPLVRLESVNSDISDSMQRSFGVDTQLTLYIQKPMWVCYDKGHKRIEKINIDFTRLGHEPITSNSMRAIINESLTDKFSDSVNVIRRNLLIHDLTEFDLTELNVNDIAYSIFSIKFPKDALQLQTNFKFNIFDVKGKIHTDIKSSLLDIDANEVKFKFKTSYLNEFYKATLTSPIIFQVVDYRTDKL